MGTNKSWEGSPMKGRKSRGSNAILHMVEGRPVESSKSWESNSLVRTVSYSDILRRKILLCLLLYAHSLILYIGYQRANFMHLNPSSSQSRPCESPVGVICINSTVFFSRSFIIALKNLSPVSTYCSRAIFQVGGNNFSPFFLVIISRVHIDLHVQPSPGLDRKS